MTDPAAVLCTYCGQAAVLIDSSAVYYGKSYGPMWRCEPCDAHVGCHKGTTKPLGTLANKALRDRRQQVHWKFDPIWKNSRRGGARSEAYLWLAGHLEIPYSECHIALFDLDRCTAAIEVIATKPWPFEWDDPLEDAHHQAHDEGEGR